MNRESSAYHKALKSADRCLAYASRKNRSGQTWDPDRDPIWQKMLRQDDEAWKVARRA